jgi:phosphoribosylformylglycinamidine synthase subunit PurS
VLRVLGASLAVRRPVEQYGGTGRRPEHRERSQPCAEPGFAGRERKAAEDVKVTVLVRPKQGILDPQGEAVQGSLRKLGFAVGGARVGRLVDLEVEAPSPKEARAQVERMCQELLANPLIESFEIEVDGA